MLQINAETIAYSSVVSIVRNKKVDLHNLFSYLLYEANHYLQNEFEITYIISYYLEVSRHICK